MPVRYLSLGEVVELHRLVTEQAGGAAGVCDLGALESAVAQPRATFAGVNRDGVVPVARRESGRVGYSLALNHPFVDGNKRVAHAALETFLVLNGRELAVTVDDAEHTMLALAAGMLSREEFVAWVARHLAPLRT